MGTQYTELYRELLCGVLFVLSFVLFLGTRRISLLVSILLRWLRCGTISVTIACLLKMLSTPRAPFGLLVCTGILVCFLVESITAWIRVHRGAVINAPILLRYASAEDCMLWPNSSDAWRNAQQSLTKFGFSHECILRAHWDEKLAFFCQILLSADHRTRMVVHFPVTFCEHSSPSVMLYSIATNGEMIITDNCYGTFGGYYPSSWDVDRRPLLRSIDRLHALHSRRLNGRSLLKLLAPALSSLNMMQKSIIDENLMRNFFLVVQENGGNLLRLADEAGFRVWAEMFLLKYFGRSLS